MAKIDFFKQEHQLNIRFYLLAHTRIRVFPFFGRIKFQNLQASFSL